MSISLINSVMAFGFQAYLTISQRSINSEERKRAQQYAKIPLRCRSSVLRSPNTLLKFQVIRTLHQTKWDMLTGQTILAMVGFSCPSNYTSTDGRFQTTISEQIDEIIHCELIASAISCARALKLDYRDFMHGSNMSNKDKDLARRSLWYLYSIEVPQCLRHGISPVGVALQSLKNRNLLTITKRYSITIGLTTLHLKMARRRIGSPSNVSTPLLSALRSRCSITSERSGNPL